MAHVDCGHDTGVRCSNITDNLGGLLECGRPRTTTNRGSLVDDLLSPLRNGNWTYYQFLPECWKVLEPLLCSVVNAECISHKTENRRVLTKAYKVTCLEMVKACPMAHIVFQDHANLLNCESDIYSVYTCNSNVIPSGSSDKGGGVAGAGSKLDSYQCLSPSHVTSNEDLWLPQTNYCGMPCDQLEPFSSFTPAIVLSSFLVQLCVLLFLHFSPQKSGVIEFKFLKLLLLVDALVTLCVSLMPFVHNFSNFCEKSSNLLEMKLHPEWSMKFAFSATIAFSMSFLVIIEWFWLVLRLKYFPMAKCVAFGDKQYQTIASPKKVKTINFVAIMFAFSLALGLACLGEIIPNFISRTPSIVINHSFLFAFEPAAVFILQLALSFMLLTDSIRHHAFKLSFVIMATFICISNAIRFYCFHNSRSFQNSFMNFFFEEIWKCRLLNLHSKVCPDSLPAIVAWPDIVLLVLRFLDYIFLFYALHILLPLKKPLNLFTSIKEIMQPASPSFLNKTTKPKVTVLVSNQSSDGMVETFYSPSPSMNFKDMQIVHLGGTNSPDRGGIAMKQLKSSLDVAKTRSGKHALVRAEVSNPDSYTPQSPQVKTPDHQLVNCPDCAKTIRVATWVNYLPQPTPKRKHFVPHPIRARALGNLDPNVGMAGSPSSSNTFSPVYPLQVPVARNPHINAPTAPSTVSRSFPGSPVLSHRSSSVGSSRKTSSKSAKKADSGTEVLSTRLIPESHQRILSQYNASPVALRRKKPLSPLVTSDRKIENQSVMPSGSQSNPATLRAQRSLAFNEPSSPVEAPQQLPTQESIRPTELDLESGNRISNSTTASRSNQGGSDSFDSEEDTRTEIGLCTSLL